MTDSFDLKEVKLAIASSRFPFPNDEKPAWRTYINEGESSSMGLPAVDGDIYPDIVVIDRASNVNKYLMAAAVCADEPGLEDMVLWRRISNVVDFFYVFVTKGHCRRAADLAETGNIHISGFRWFSPDSGSTEINDCF